MVFHRYLLSEEAVFNGVAPVPLDELGVHLLVLGHTFDAEHEVLVVRYHVVLGRLFCRALVWRSSKLAALPYMPVLSHSMGISLVKVSTSGIWTPADTAQYGTIHHDMLRYAYDTM